MRSLCAFPISVVLFATVAYSQSQTNRATPSLKETLQWMHETLGPKGLTYQDRNGWSYYSAVPNTHYSELIISFSFEGCNIRVVKDIETLNPLIGREPFLSEETETFNLGDLDPKSINSDTGDGTLIGSMLTVSTTNDKKAIHCQTINKNLGKDYNKDAGCIPADDDSEQLRFSSKEYTQRFAKALRHAIILCGGKPSSF